MQGKYLITTDNWFIAPDGEQYRAAWGDVKIIEDNILGIKTNRGSSNWFAKVGKEGKEIIIAGCQIHYAVRSDNQPSTEPPSVELEYEGALLSKKSTTTRIYIAE